MEHNCTNYGGAEQCTRCLKEAKAEVRRLNLQIDAMRDAMGLFQKCHVPQRDEKIPGCGCPGCNAINRAFALKRKELPPLDYPAEQRACQHWAAGLDSDVCPTCGKKFGAGQ